MVSITGKPSWVLAVSVVIWSLEVSIRLFDMNGKVVFQSSAEYSGREFAYALPDLSSLPDGFYTLEVSDGLTIREMCKLIKQ